MNLDDYKKDIVADALGYSSPINFTIKEVANDIRANIEDKLFYEVKEEINVDIDRDELIKALNYDRDSYNKGYLKGFEEGKRMAMLTLGESLVKKYGGDSDEIRENGMSDDLE